MYMRQEHPFAYLQTEDSIQEYRIVTVLKACLLYTSRTFLLRLGLIGDEYKNVRKHLLANLDGDKAWRYDKSTYACLQNPRRTDDAR